LAVSKTALGKGLGNLLQTNGSVRLPEPRPGVARENTPPAGLDKLLNGAKGHSSEKIPGAVSPRLALTLSLVSADFLLCAFAVIFLLLPGLSAAAALACGISAVGMGAWLGCLAALEWNKFSVKKITALTQRIEPRFRGPSVQLHR
jgi:hypothetical protein